MFFCWTAHENEELSLSLQSKIEIIAEINRLKVILVEKKPRKEDIGMYSIKDIAEYIVALIAAFARHFSMSEADAYQYLRRYGAVKVAHEFYDVMHTQSFDDMVQSMASYCRRKGGEL